MLASQAQDVNAPNSLQAMQDLVAYLVTLVEQPEHASLVFEYSKMVLQKEPDLGLSIFTYSHTHPTPDGQPMSPHAVLEHLKKFCDTDGCIAYLESLIQVRMYDLFLL